MFRPLKKRNWKKNHRSFDSFTQNLICLWWCRCSGNITATGSYIVQSSYFVTEKNLSSDHSMHLANRTVSVWSFQMSLSLIICSSKCQATFCHLVKRVAKDQQSLSRFAWFKQIRKLVLWDNNNVTQAM